MPSRGLVLAREPRRPPSPEPPTGSSRTRFQTPTTSPPTWPRRVLPSPFVSFCLSAWSSPPFAARGFTKSKLIPNLLYVCSHPGLVLQDAHSPSRTLLQVASFAS